MKWFDKLKKYILDPVWLFHDQKLIPTFFSEVKNSFWWNLTGWKSESMSDKHGQLLAEMNLCGIWLLYSNATYIFMVSRTVPVAYAGNV